MSLKTQKIGSSFVKEISYIIMEEIKDPDIKFVSVDLPQPFYPRRPKILWLPTSKLTLFKTIYF